MLCLFLGTDFQKITLQIFLCLFVIKKVDKWKTLSSQKKFGLISRKVFFFYLRRKTFSENCEKIRNVILFVDYIKFGPQTFDCYIYFVLNIYFSILSLRI